MLVLTYVLDWIGTTFGGTMATNRFANYREGKDMKSEKSEPKALQRFEKSKGMDKGMAAHKSKSMPKKSGRGC